MICDDGFGFERFVGGAYGFGGEYFGGTNGYAEGDSIVLDIFFDLSRTKSCIHMVILKIIINIAMAR